MWRPVKLVLTALVSIVRIGGGWFWNKTCSDLILDAQCREWPGVEARQVIADRNSLILGDIQRVDRGRAKRFGDHLPRRVLSNNPTCRCRHGTLSGLCAMYLGSDGVDVLPGFVVFPAQGDQAIGRVDLA